MRPSKLTPTLHDAIVNAVQAGVPLVTAGQYVGVRERTLHEWIARGEGRHVRGSTSACAQFALAVEKARAADEVRRLVRLEQAARGGAVVYEKTTTYPDGRVTREVRTTPPEWTCDAWFLERSRPESWGRKDRMDLRVNIEKAAQKVAEELGITPEEDLAEAQTLLAELNRGTHA